MGYRHLTTVALAVLAAGCGPADKPTDDAGAKSEVAAPAAAADTPTQAAYGETPPQLVKLLREDGPVGRLDTEMTRLFVLAAGDPKAVPAGDALEAEQAKWVRQRNACATNADPKSCLLGIYPPRLEALLTNSARARDDRNKAVFDGPQALRCKGIDALITATFINVDPNLVHLSWLGTKAVTLTQVASGSGAKYSGTGPDGKYELFTKGDDALFTRPGSNEAECAFEVIG